MVFRENWGIYYLICILGWVFLFGLRMYSFLLLGLVVSIMFLDILKCILCGVRLVIIMVCLLIRFFGVYVDLMLVNIWWVLLFKFSFNCNSLLVFFMCFVLVMCVICRLIFVKLLKEMVLLIGFFVSGLFGLIFGLVVRFFFDVLIIVLILFILICCIIGLNLLMVWLVSIDWLFF